MEKKSKHLTESKEEKDFKIINRPSEIRSTSSDTYLCTTGEER